MNKVKEIKNYKFKNIKNIMKSKNRETKKAFDLAKAFILKKIFKNPIL